MRGLVSRDFRCDLSVKLLGFCAFVLLLFGGANSGYAQAFEEKVTNASNIRLTVTNTGTFGNAFRGYRDGTGQRSCEYPAGSGIEHLFEGGIWIGGANRSRGGAIEVSTSAFDAPQGYAPGRAGFEFTIPPGSPPFRERSSLFDSRFFSNAAVSHQDFVAVFNDSSQVVPGTNTPIAGHQFPMNVQVTMETYNWNYSFSDFFVVVNMTLKNIGNSTYDSVFVGLWNNTVVRNINITPAGAGGATFFSQGGNGYMDSLRLAYCFDATGDVGFTDSYIGQKFLGSEDKFGFHHPQLDSTYNQIQERWVRENFMANYQSWQFNNSSNPIFFFPSNDEQRYQKMANGMNDHPCWTNPNSADCQQSFGVDLQNMLNAPGNRSDIVSAGPYRDFTPGDEITVTFAYIIAPKNDDGNPNSENNLVQRQNLIDNANWVQTAYNGEDVNFNGVLDPGEDQDGSGKITRFILPAPPDRPITRVLTSENKIDIFWSDNSFYSVDPISQEMDFEGFRVYMTPLGFDVTGTPDVASNLVKIAEFDIPDNGYFNETGFESILLDEPKMFPNDTNQYWFKYTIDNLPNGWQHAVSVTAFDRGNEEINLESLESAPLSNQFRAFAGTAPNDAIEDNAPYVYPNPYYYGAAWEGRSNFQEESRKIIFANLPRRCRIKIFTPAGDLIDEIEHDEQYDGQDIRWFRTFGAENPEQNVFSGGERAWDLLSKSTQIIARGMYLFTVYDLDTGVSKSGTFAIIK
ncbi:MAG: hypothetical protein JJU02_15725 [Cryomorphaceae bacterium]|nr:hypothetical protein [Cryomorphaceae bacterium]